MHDTIAYILPVRVRVCERGMFDYFAERAGSMQRGNARKTLLC